MFDISKVDENFPLPEYRPGQRAAIIKTLESFNSGCRYVLLEAPTGSGKSAIGFTIGQLAEKSYYLAPQKFLQDQLTSDFGDYGRHTGERYPMIDLKGRNAYTCNFWNRALADKGFDWSEWGENEDEIKQKFGELSTRKFGCDRGQCKRDGQSKLPYCVDYEKGIVECPYYVRMREARASKICLMNFHSFLFQTSVVKSFKKRQLLIIDEAHNTEDVLLKFVELKLSDRHFQSMGVRFPFRKSVDEYVAYFREIELEEKINHKLKEAIASLDTKSEEEWKNQLLRYSILLEADPTQWVSMFEESDNGVSRTITLKPIFIDKFAQRYIFDQADYVLFMSATILSKRAVCEALGVKVQEAKMFRLNSTFPVENRPLYFRPSGRMGYEYKKATLPKMVEDINNICKHHQNERGIIHTHSFDILSTLIENCAPEVRSRFLHQRDSEFDGNKQALLKRHSETPNSIIIAPAMHEGLDLKDDLGRFQIICKVPYPSKNDPQIAARMEISGEYYNWRAATKLTQSYGRIIRHDADWGCTYVLDADFKRFVQNCDDMLPTWFQEAIIWEG